MKVLIQRKDDVLEEGIPIHDVDPIKATPLFLENYGISM